MTLRSANAGSSDFDPDSSFVAEFRIARLAHDLLSEGKQSAVVAASFTKYRQLQELAVYSSVFVTRTVSLVRYAEPHPVNEQPRHVIIWQHTTLVLASRIGVEWWRDSAYLHRRVPSHVQRYGLAIVSL